MFVLIIQGCASQSSEAESLPGVDVEPGRINTDFTVYEDPVGGSANTHKNNEILAVDVKNQGNTQINFLPGFVKIFAKIDDQWTPIDNVIRYPEIERILPTTKDFPPGMIVSVIPSILNMTEPTLIRIFLEGELVDSNQKVGAYMDVKLLP